jgi:Transmembrane secretion effector
VATEQKQNTSVWLALKNRVFVWLWIASLISGSASELWIASQREMPDWARGRMNAVNIMASQGGVALGGILWGWSATALGLSQTLLGGAVLLSASLVLAIPLSINFAQSLNFDAAPIDTRFHNFPLAPKPDDGPVTIVQEYIIRPKDRGEFLALQGQVRMIMLRNGAFLYHVDESLENPGTFRVEQVVSSWAEHLRQHARATKAENEILQRAWGMDVRHVGDGRPVAHHYVKANRMSAPQTIIPWFGKGTKLQWPKTSSTCR